MMVNYDIATVREFVLYMTSNKNGKVIIPPPTELALNSPHLFVFPTKIRKRIPPTNTSCLKSWSPPFTKGGGPLLTQCFGRTLFIASLAFVDQYLSRS